MLPHSQRARREEAERELIELRRTCDVLEQRLAASDAIAKADLVRLESELRVAGACRTFLVDLICHGTPLKRLVGTRVSLRLV